MIVPETYHVPFCATHAQTFFASEGCERSARAFSGSYETMTAAATIMLLLKK